MGCEPLDQIVAVPQAYAELLRLIEEVIVPRKERYDNS
jgi:hypothetical protein